MKLRTAIFLIVIAICFSHCNSDDCDGNNCNNHGFCVNGDCDCLDGYLGTFCEARETDEYLGLFDAFRTCDPDEDVIDFEIRESQLDARKIYFDFDGLTIYAIAFPTEFTIPDQQFLNLYVIHETSGTKNGRVLDFEFSYTYLGIPSYSEICQFRIIQPN